jgi:hypothetical protein
VTLFAAVHESGIDAERRTAASHQFGRYRRAQRTCRELVGRVDPTLLTQCMVRPCVARGFRRSGGRAVLHQCIRLLIGACCAPSHHGYQRACGLITGPASNGPFGSPVFACAGKTDPPSRLILSQTSAGKAVGVMSSIAPYLYAVPLFVPEARSFVPACACAGAPRARGRQGWPSRLLCLLLQRRQATP